MELAARGTGDRSGELPEVLEHGIRDAAHIPDVHWGELPPGEVDAVGLGPWELHVAGVRERGGSGD